MFEVGEKVIYSDLSSWEICTLVRKTESENLDWVVRFDGEQDTLEVQECGMRKYTPENVERYLS